MLKNELLEYDGDVIYKEKHIDLVHSEFQQMFSSLHDKHCRMKK